MFLPLPCFYLLQPVTPTYVVMIGHSYYWHDYMTYKLACLVKIKSFYEKRRLWGFEPTISGSLRLLFYLQVGQNFVLLLLRNNNSNNNNHTNILDIKHNLLGQFPNKPSYPSDKFISDKFISIVRKTLEFDPS